jgi:type IV pilus assembly protein PilW
VQVSLCATQVTKYRLGLEGTAAFDRQTKACSGALTDKREYVAHIYYIATDNGSGQNIPTLKRLELNGGGWDTVPLVEGIEQLQFVYGLDTNSDGVPDQYVANPNDYPAGACSGTCPRDNWMNIVTVQYYLLARNLETSSDYVDTKTYTLGTDATGNPISVGPFNDGYRRHIYSGLVRIVNPAGRRDTP